MYPCIECNLEVRARQQAVQCDDCGKWQHRKCNSGVDQLTYRLAAITERFTGDVPPLAERLAERSRWISNDFKETSIIGVGELVQVIS